MKVGDFNASIESFFANCFHTVCEKGKVYGGEDRLGQIKEIALVRDETPESAAHGLMTKHFIALKHMCETPERFSVEKFYEYIGDIAIYSGIILAIRQEREETIQDVINCTKEEL